MQRRKVGIIGFGYIASFIYRELTNHPENGLDVAFVWNRTAANLEHVPDSIVLDNLSDFAERSPDLVVEMAHPSVSRDYAKAFLGHCDYMMLSVTAMADDALSESLLNTAQKNSHSLFIPRGALVGVDALHEGRDNWADVSITFRKAPGSIDFSATEIDPAEIDTETIVYDGPVRGAAEKFPRNVNTMATCALASLGFDRTRGIMIVDPDCTVMSAHVVAHGINGSLLETKIAEQAVGVSGTGMLLSQLGSIRRAASGASPGLHFV